ncbi:MAG: MATE family efflux transporter [Clostridia bacterium]|nr:MATE family efflux transporter [Clostridia bacterium]MBQ5649434.1 MATE family efflux transporter [Clostridia bacterium]MBR0326538.1 MATE family efflux transporter [Clostridia bacterium]
MLFSKQDIRKILFPLLVEQILAVALGMFDSMMVSSVGEAAVSGVSLVDSISILLINVFSALATGGAVVCSQFLGHKDTEGARSSAKQLYYAVFAVSSLLMTIALVFSSQILHLIFGKVEADVMAFAKTYFVITAISYPFLGLYNGGAALFRAMGNSKISLYVSLAMNLLNVGGNALLIYGFKLGVAGAAISTLAARIFGAAVMLILSHNRKNTIYVDNILRFRPSFPIIRRILRIGIPGGMENGMFQVGKLLTQSLVASLPTAIIAANSVANTLASFQYAAGGAVGLTLITVIGRCTGAGEKEQAKHYAKSLLFTAYKIMLITSVLLTIFPKPIIGLFELSTEATDAVLRLVLLHNLATVLIWPLAFTLPHCFRAASDVMFPMVTSIISMWVFRVVCSYIFVLYFHLGVYGVWLAMFCDWLFRGSMFFVRLISNKWLLKYSKT